ncbi:hypothetical protein J7E88_05945 [Streptomyces sp. ISL-10]|nr:hypothetical protein [Streptomyces sp. ISL-10]
MPGPETAAAAPGPVQERPPSRGRAGRTVGLIAAAAVLGLVAGTAVGYGVQADCEPTPLPALNQPDLAYPAKPLPAGESPARAAAVVDLRAEADGDLRKLLLPRPSGARKAEFLDDEGWLDTAGYASEFKQEGRALEFMLENRIRRVAITSWESGEHRQVHIQLVQFRSSGTIGAAVHTEDAQEWLSDPDYADDDGDVLPGSGNGRYYLFPVEREPGYLDFYEARAVFYRGDVMAEVSIWDAKKISKKDIRSLAERQLERL